MGKEQKPTGTNPNKIIVVNSKNQMVQVPPDIADLPEAIRAMRKKELDPRATDSPIMMVLGTDLVKAKQPKINPGKPKPLAG